MICAEDSEQGLKHLQAKTSRQKELSASGTIKHIGKADTWMCRRRLRWGAGAETAELAKRPLSFIRGFRLCLRGAGKPLKHSARQASLSNTNSWSSLRLTSIESVMPSSHLETRAGRQRARYKKQLRGKGKQQSASFFFFTIIRYKTLSVNFSILGLLNNI